MYLYLPVDPIVNFPMYPVLSHMSFTVCVYLTYVHNTQHQLCPTYSQHVCTADLHSTLEPKVWAESSTAAFHKRVCPKLGYPKFTGYHVSPLKW